MIISHISNIAQVQTGWKSGFILIMIISIFNSIGRIFGGSFSDKVGRINTLRVLFIFQALNMLVFRTVDIIPIMIASASIAGFCYGAGFAVFPAAIGDLYGTKYFGLNYGLLFTAYGLGGILGPLIGAAVFDSSGTYANAFVISFILLVISIFLTFTYNHHNKNIDTKKKINRVT